MKETPEETFRRCTLRRCHASVLRIADLVEAGDLPTAIETCHYIAADLEDVLGEP